MHGRSVDFMYKLATKNCLATSKREHDHRQTVPELPPKHYRLFSEESSGKRRSSSEVALTSITSFDPFTGGPNFPRPKAFATFVSEKNVSTNQLQR